MTYREKIVEILQTKTGKRKMQSSKAKIITDALLANDVIVLNHGRWLKNPTGFTNDICSICFGDSGIDERGCPIRTNFCPNCGAKMDGGASDG